MSGTVRVIVGGQYGSEGKGHITGYLAAHPGPYDQDVTDTDEAQQVTVVRVAGPNAGHTAYDAKGRKHSLRQVPVAAVTNLDARLVIAAGSEIDPPVLTGEVHDLEAAGIPIAQRLFVDGEATVVTSEHKEQEGHYGGALTQRIGSTGKGIGAARSERIWRRAPRWGDTPENTRLEMWADPIDTAAMLETQLQAGHDVLIEGTQGYALGLHAGFYPFCTSSDCRTIDFLAMAGISPWARCVRAVEPWVVMRTYPIRVAGNSGFLHGEISWKALGELTGGHVQPEFTTVTHMERRVGSWDAGLAQQAVLANGGPEVQVALTMFDYWYPDLYEACDVDDLTDEQFARVEGVQKAIGAPVRILGTGPHTLIDLRKDT